MEHDVSLPDLVRQVNLLRYEYADGDGIDYEGFEEWLPPGETKRWFQAWTGNQTADSACFRVFGQDGTGGNVAFRVIRDDPDMLSQPIVFLGSEGETALLARNVNGYVWLLAAGIGPAEAASFPDETRVAQPALASFAEANAGPRQDALRVLADASDAFPTSNNLSSLSAVSHGCAGTH